MPGKFATGATRASKPARTTQQPVTASPGRTDSTARCVDGGPSAIVDLHDSSRTVATSVSRGRCVESPRHTTAGGERNDRTCSEPRNTTSRLPLADSVVWVAAVRVASSRQPGSSPRQSSACTTIGCCASTKHEPAAIAAASADLADPIVALRHDRRSRGDLAAIFAQVRVRPVAGPHHDGRPRSPAAWPTGVACIHFGVTLFMPESPGAVVGVSNLRIGGAMRGQTLEAFRKARNAPGARNPVAGADSKPLDRDRKQPGAGS